MLIPKIIGKFQMQTSKHINLLNDTPGNKIWQTGYHDHIIRNNDEYQCIKYYIRNNPKNWEEDTFYS
ncbi:MAG: transposase [Bacteroidetes bacterium]|nr:transposase [Bacteroidota bacterium]MBL7103206.1 transposase [Bacteroidales bacterium]